MSRRAPVLLVLLFACACFPRLEGAPCLNDLHCPSSQTCAEGACRTRCTLPCDDGLVCGFEAGAALCRCPMNAEGTIFVDSSGGSRAAEAPFPTGVRTPESCRFARPGEALERARQVFEQSGGAPVEVVSVAGEAHVYAADTYPLEIPAGVTFRSEDRDPARHTLSFRTNGDMVHLGGRLEAITLRNESPGAPGNAVRVACQNGTAVLESVVIEAADAGFTLWLRGVSVEGCRLDAHALSVRGAQTGVAVEASPGTRFAQTQLERNDVGLEVQGGSVSGEAALHDNGVGLSLSGGSVELRASLRSNDVGLHVSGGSVTLQAPSEVTLNADAGVVLEAGGMFTYQGAADAGLAVTGNGVGLVSRGGSARVSFATFSGNAAEAIRIDEPDGVARPHVFTDSLFETEQPLPLVRVSRLGGAEASGEGFHLERSQLVGGTRALELGPGPVTVTIRGNTIMGASEAGLHYTRAAGSVELLDANRIVGNGSGGSLEGGVVLGGTGGTLAFTANRVAGNAQQQIVILSSGWSLAARCESASSVYCYAPDGYGVFASSGSADVTLYWPRATPLSLYNDYNSGISASSCGAVSDATCP